MTKFEIGEGFGYNIFQQQKEKENIGLEVIEGIQYNIYINT